MNATKLSISLDAASMRLLDLVKETYKCSNRSQAIARTLELFKEVSEQQALEDAYALSGVQDSDMNANFSFAQSDGLADETW
jgi:metal-responsive CopG/Arc/MetJ family transcriptional regulator